MKLYTNITLIQTPNEATADADFDQLGELGGQIDAQFGYPSVVTMDNGQLVLKVLNITSADDYFDIHQLIQNYSLRNDTETHVDLPELLKFLNDKHLPSEE